MRRLSIMTALCFMLQACLHGYPATQTQPKKADSVQQSTNPHCPPARDSNVEQWLYNRHKLCQLPVEVQKSKSKQLRTSEAADVMANILEQLSLASCQPELTPGLLSQALNDISKATTLSANERYLVELINSFYHSNRILEVKNLQLKAELERTIKGIRDIEADIGNIKPNGGRREQ